MDHRDTRLHTMFINIDIADDVLTGRRAYVLAQDERCYEKGDQLIFLAISLPKYRICDHRINSKAYEITYVRRGFGGKSGIVELGIQEVDM